MENTPPPLVTSKCFPSFHCLRAPVPDSNTACHLATAQGQAPNSAFPKYYKWSGTEFGTSSRRSEPTVVRVLKSTDREGLHLRAHQHAALGVPRELTPRASSACVLSDWLADPAPQPMGARLIVRRAAGRRGGRGRQAVAVETPGKFLGGWFGGIPQMGARLC